MRSRLLEFQEENNALQSKITSLEVTSHGATEQEKLIGKKNAALVHAATETQNVDDS